MKMKTLTPKMLKISETCSFAWETMLKKQTNFATGGQVALYFIASGQMDRGYFPVLKLLPNLAIHKMAKRSNDLHFIPKLITLQEIQKILEKVGDPNFF